MKYALQYIRSTNALINAYDGAAPLAVFLKQYFSEQKKYGSKDRKWITHLCYTYYRLGQALKDHLFEERLKTALFLCNDTPGEWDTLYDSSWLDQWSDDLAKRIEFIQVTYSDFFIEDVFPWTGQLSEGIDKEWFLVSHFIQPDLFLRIRPGRQKIVKQKLDEQKISFEQLSDTCIALPNASKIDTVLDLDQEVVIQDYSSQQIAAFFKLTTHYSPLTAQHSKFSIWDCCAASGGKSLLAKDTLPGFDLTVSDIRPTILRNLEKRFENACIKNYHSFIADLSKESIKLSPFDLIICDAPCSGSGTWGRTPEQLWFFREEKINEYTALQKNIVKNIVTHISANGYLLYITCSVFKKENEEMVDLLCSEGSLELIRYELLTGYENKADSMFAALFQAKR